MMAGESGFFNISAKKKKKEEEKKQEKKQEKKKEKKKDADEIDIHLYKRAKTRMTGRDECIWGTARWGAQMLRRNETSE